MAKAKQAQDIIVVVGAKAHPLRDIYHRLMAIKASHLLLTIVGAFLVINALFAVVFEITGGIDGGNEPGSFADAFFFSAQTLGTIGYGTMHPVTLAANLAVVSETIVGILFIAITTGLVFSRFSRSSETIVFSKSPCIGPIDGVPSLTLRIGNDREGSIADAHVRVAYVYTQRTKEGTVLYRMQDLVLSRDHTPLLGRTWTVIHTIDEKSPLYCKTIQACEQDEVELVVSVVGTDAVSMQPVHGGIRYEAKDFRWNARLGDVLTELPDGRLQLDVRKFDDVVDLEG